MEGEMNEERREFLNRLNELVSESPNPREDDVVWRYRRTHLEEQSQFAARVAVNSIYDATTALADNNYRSNFERLMNNTSLVGQVSDFPTNGSTSLTIDLGDDEIIDVKEMYKELKELRNRVTKLEEELENEKKRREV